MNMLNSIFFRINGELALTSFQLNEFAKIFEIVRFAKYESDPLFIDSNFIDPRFLKIRSLGTFIFPLLRKYNE